MSVILFPSQISEGVPSFSFINVNQHLSSKTFKKVISENSHNYRGEKFQSFSLRSAKNFTQNKYVQHVYLIMSYLLTYVKHALNNGRKDRCAE